MHAAVHWLYAPSRSTRDTLNSVLAGSVLYLAFALMQFADLSAGMVLLHVFAFPRTASDSWLPLSNPMTCGDSPQTRLSSGVAKMSLENSSMMGQTLSG